jgi:hypothetical protein
MLACCHIWAAKPHSWLGITRSLGITIGITRSLSLNHIPPSTTIMTYPLPVFAMRGSRPRQLAHVIVSR